MSMPFLDPDSLAQPEDYREGPLADDPPSSVEIDTDASGNEVAPTLSAEAAEIAERLHGE